MVVGWNKIKLIDHSTLKARIGWQGLTTAEYLDEGEAFLVTGTDFFNGAIKWNTCHYVDKFRFDQDTNIQLRNGDILITKDGTIGKVAFVEGLSKKATLNSGVFVLRPKKTTYEGRYMYYVLLSDTFSDFLSKLSAGSTITHLYQKDFVTFECEISTDINEQRRIANALSDTDALISVLEKLIDKKCAIRQGAMQELLTGKLRLGGFSGEWVENTLESLCYLITKQTGFDYTATIKPSLANEKRYGYIPFIQNKDFEGEKINFKTDFYVPMEIALQFPKILLDEPCLLVSISGRIGNVAYFNNSELAFVGGAVGVAKFHRSEIAKWVMLYLQSPIGQKMIFANEKAGAQHNLTIEDIRNFIIPCPGMEEQSAIASILADMDAEIDALTTKLNKLRNIKQGMMSELLTGRIRLLEEV
ncbi:MAG: type restriction enzyme [Herbinix sp.]|jgi:type I restriction enzyme S subunit|nr:type restriction enzyme [Herbinix sp.]